MAQRIFVAGASRGIGLEMVRQTAARGDDVTGTARDDGGMKRIEEAGARALKLDVTDQGALAAASAAIGGPLDLLVCNAGTTSGRGGIDADGLDAEDWSRVLMTNVAGVFMTVRAMLPHLEAARGRIAIMTSLMGSSARPYGGSFLYCASKAGATNLARNLSVALKERGVAVGAYHPGWVRTDMGGPNSTLSPEDSVRALLARFEALSLETTGACETYKGKPIEF